MKNNNFLSIETSLDRVFLVLFIKNKLFHLERKIKSSIEIVLNLMMKEILETNKAIFTDLSFILVSLGPGSYTGTRVGLATAKAISISIGKPILGYSNFESIYQQGVINGLLNTNNEIGIIIKANKYEFYFQRIDNEEKSKIQVISRDLIYKKNNLPEPLLGNFKDNNISKKYIFCEPSKQAIYNTFNKKKIYININKINDLKPYYPRGHYAKS